MRKVNLFLSDKSILGAFLTYYPSFMSEFLDTLCLQIDGVHRLHRVGLGRGGGDRESRGLSSNLVKVVLWIWVVGSLWHWVSKKAKDGRVQGYEVDRRGLFRSRVQESSHQLHRFLAKVSWIHESRTDSTWRNGFIDRTLQGLESVDGGDGGPEDHLQEGQEWKGAGRHPEGVQVR